jgi:hypothetical protein
VRSVVAGRLINGYSKEDWILALMHRSSDLVLNVAGLNEVAASGVENYDVGEIVRGRHSEYGKHIKEILEFVRFER